MFVMSVTAIINNRYSKKFKIKLSLNKFYFQKWFENLKMYKKNTKIVLFSYLFLNNYYYWKIKLLMKL